MTTKTIIGKLLKSAGAVKVRGWMRPLDLSDGPEYGTLDAKIEERAVTVQLGNGAKIDLYLDDDGSLHAIAHARDALIVGRGADGDGIELRVERRR